MKLKVRATLKGGPGSGHFGHAGRPGKVGGSTTSGKSLNVPVRELDDGAYSVFDYIKPTADDYRKFNNAIDELPEDIKKLWTGEDGDTILAIMPGEKYYAKSSGNWVILGEFNQDSTIQHEFIHRIINQSHIIGEITSYNPGDHIWHHANDYASDIYNMLNEDLTMTLGHYHPNIDDWVDDMVKNGDYLQGYKHITNDIARDKALRVIDFFARTELW